MIDALEKAPAQSPDSDLRAIPIDEPLREFVSRYPIDQLTAAIWSAAKSRGLDPRNISAAWAAMELTENPLPMGGRAPFALEESGWRDLTAICDITDDGKTERRLMIDPNGKFHIVSELCNDESKEWKVAIAPVNADEARKFYLRHAIPEPLQKAFSPTPEMTSNGDGDEWPIIELEDAVNATQAFIALLMDHIIRFDSGESHIFKDGVAAGLMQLEWDVEAKLNAANEKTYEWSKKVRALMRLAAAA